MSKVIKIDIYVIDARYVLAPACSLCRRYAPYDWSEAKWRNLYSIIIRMRFLHYDRNDRIKRIETSQLRSR
ncbi:MAG: hypothetical protein K2J75_01610 [Clostridia bacterium]|nr:hypothetical protein [Clostridia bacterium]